MIILAIFIVFCIYFYKSYLIYDAKAIIGFQIFCLIYFWLNNYLIDELNKQDKEIDEELYKRGQK